MNHRDEIQGNTKSIPTSAADWLATRGKIPIGTNLTFRIFHVHEELIKLVKKQNVFIPYFLNWAAIFDRMLTATFW